MAYYCGRCVVPELDCGFDFSIEAGPEAPGTVQELVSWYEIGYAKGVARVRRDAGSTGPRINFFNIYNLPAGMYLNFLVNHQVHDRGQLSTYLRAMNAHVPSI